MSHIANDNARGELKITRRHLPHWTLKGVTYFITFRTSRTDKNICPTLSVEEQKLVLKHVINGNKKFYNLIAAIVMPDHVHLLLIPTGGYTISRIMKGIKGTSGSTWQEESFDRIVRDQNELDEKLNYMMDNPAKRGLTDNTWNYHGWYFNDGRSDILV